MTGPGKPYWKRPAGSTRAAAEAGTGGRGAGAGGGAEKTLDAGTVPGAVVDTEVVVAVVIAVGTAVARSTGFARREYIAAVTAAPVPALTAAMTAMVDLDMVRGASVADKVAKVRW